MSKLRKFITIVCSICLFALPSSSFAKMTLMSDEELDQITAQAGFSDMLGIIQVKQDDETGTYYFGGPQGGYLSFADMSYEGTIGLDPSTAIHYVNNNGNPVVEYHMNGPVMDVRNFSTTIRLGTEIGAGQSLGSLYMGRFAVNVHGTMRITTK
jgi:hypothetical protein